MTNAKISPKSQGAQVRSTATLDIGLRTEQGKAYHASSLANEKEREKPRLGSRATATLFTVPKSQREDMNIIQIFSQLLSSNPSRASVSSLKTRPIPEIKG